MKRQRREAIKKMKKHICIDFEGEGTKGRKGNRVVPQPALLGALVPNLEGHGKRYYLWLLKPELAPMERSPWLPGNAKQRKTCSFEEAIQDVVDLSRFVLLIFVSTN